MVMSLLLLHRDIEYDSNHGRLCRQLLYSLFISFQPIWREQQSFAASLLNNLISDVERLAGGQNSAITRDNLRQLLGLSSCITAIIQACGPENLPIQGKSTCMNYITVKTLHYNAAGMKKCIVNCHVCACRLAAEACQSHAISDRLVPWAFP